MVSIPDWSRLQRLGDFPAKETTLPQSRYYKQREEETIKQAEEQGYFLNPCRYERNPCMQEKHKQLHKIHYELFADYTAWFPFILL